MSKEEFLKIQTCVLKVNIHCDGCKHKVKKILQKIEGVYTIKIDSEQGKVTVSGNVDSSTLIKKLVKNGKHAEIWGAPKSNNNNQNQLNNQFKNLQLDNGKGGNNNNTKGQAQKGGGGGGNNSNNNNNKNNNNNNQQKGGANNNNNSNQAKGGGQNPQFQQLQQMKGFQDMKMMGQLMKDMKMPANGKDQNAKSVKFKVPEDDGGLSEDDYDDDFDDDDEDDFDDDDLDDEMDDGPPSKMKPVMGKGPGGSMGLPNMMHNMLNGQNPHLGKGAGGGNGGNNGSGGGNGKKGGGGVNIPVQMNHGGGKKGANENKSNNNAGGNQNQNQGGKGGKNGGGGNNGQAKNGGGGGGNGMMNGAKKAGGSNDMSHGMPGMMGGAHMGNMQMGPMGGQMGNLAAVQGLPASGGGYFQGGVGGGPERGGPGGGPYNGPYQQQQQMAAMMMNQQRANGNERFQPMMYARPPPAVNYMPSPYGPYHGGYPSYPPPGERVDQYSMFSDENTDSCAVM